jgi:hypothetical protein
LEAKRGVHRTAKANKSSEVVVVEQWRCLEWCCQAGEQATDAEPNLIRTGPLLIGKEPPTPIVNIADSPTADVCKERLCLGY